MDAHSLFVTVVFAVVYAGIALGRWPALAIDRTGIALCGAIVLLVGDGAADAVLRGIDVGALAILFALMVLSAQFAASGFYEWCAARVAASRASPAQLLALVVFVTGALSSILVNDIVVFAMTPILCRGFSRNGRNPLPYLLAHAGAANAGSAATLVGNPQNILIGEHGGLDFWQFFLVAGPIAVLSLFIVYGTVLVCWRRVLYENPEPVPAVPVPATLDRRALVKALGATALLLALFATGLPRWQSTLLIAGILLISRRLSTREMLAMVDWHLLVLFAGLFVVTGALGATDVDDRITGYLSRNGLSFENPAVVAAAALFGSNTIGNVPFVLLVLTAFPDLSTQAHYALAVLSTLAGNLLLVGSFATLIVAERSQREGVAITFRNHLRSGIPMTLLTCLAAAAWILVLPL